MNIRLTKVYEDHDDQKALHSFKVVVDGMTGDCASLKWFEKATRTYALGPEREGVWEDLFEKYGAIDDETNLFKEAYNCICDIKESDTVSFSIKDKPQINVRNGSRSLEFIIIFRVDEKCYAAVGRQDIMVEDGRLSRSIFAASNFKEIPDGLYLYDGSAITLEEVMKELGINNFNTRLFYAP